MPSLLDQVPEIAILPESGSSRQFASNRPDPEASATIPQPSKYERRGFLRMALVGGGALAVTMLGWVGDRIPAYAATRTSRHPQHCMGVDITGDVPCWGRQYIGSSWCASDGYHRTDSVNIDGSTRRYHYWDPACGTYAGWYWDGGSGRVSCWDGKFKDVETATGDYWWYTTSCKRSGG